MNSVVDSWRDFKRINWTTTIVLNYLRAFVAGLLWGVIFLITGINHNINILTLMPFIWPIFLIIFYLLQLFFKKVIAVIGKLLYYIGLIVICPADPILFIINKYYPHIIPVKQYPLFSKELIIYVLNE
jgi:hypothetical protein